MVYLRVLDIIFFKSNLGPTARNGFQILILHPKIHVAIRKTFSGGGHLVNFQRIFTSKFECLNAIS